MCLIHRSPFPPSTWPSLAIASSTFFAVTALFPGDSYIDRLGEAYIVLWTSTTQRQFTDIMREDPYLYAIPAVGIVFLTGWQLPRKLWARALFAYVVFGIGFVGGHVFW